MDGDYDNNHSVPVHCVAHSASPSPPRASLSPSERAEHNEEKEIIVGPIDLPAVSDELMRVLGLYSTASRQMRVGVEKGEREKARLREENEGLTRVIADLR